MQIRGQLNSSAFCVTRTLNSDQQKTLQKSLKTLKDNSKGGGSKLKSL